MNAFLAVNPDELASITPEKYDSWEIGSCKFRQNSVNPLVTTAGLVTFKKMIPGWGLNLFVLNSRKNIIKVTITKRRADIEKLYEELNVFDAIYLENFKVSWRHDYSGIVTICLWPGPNDFWACLKLKKLTNLDDDNILLGMINGKFCKNVKRFLPVIPLDWSSFASLEKERMDYFDYDIFENYDDGEDIEKNAEKFNDPSLLLVEFQKLVVFLITNTETKRKKIGFKEFPDIRNFNKPDSLQLTYKSQSDVKTMLQMRSENIEKHE